MRTTTRPRRWGTLAAVAAAAALGLAACSGDTADPGTTGAPDAATSEAETAEATSAAPETDAATAAETTEEPADGDAATTPVEYWRAPGLISSWTPGGDVLVVDPESGTAALYEVAGDGEPRWTGDCARALLLGTSVVCDAQLIDPATGSSAAFPAGTVGPAAGDADAVAMMTDDGALAGYDSSLTELWRTDGVGDSAYPFAMPGRVVATTGNATDPAAMTEWTYYDAHTGTQIADGGVVYPVVDGYVLIAADLGSVSGHTWDGAEVWTRDTPTGTTFVQAEFGVDTTVESLNPTAEDEELFEQAEGSLNPAGLIKLGGETVLYQLLADETFTVGDVVYNGAPMGVVGTGDGVHFFATTLVPADNWASSTSLYRVGSPDPLWTVDGSVAAQIDGYLLTSTDTEVIAYTFSG